MLTRSNGSQLTASQGPPGVGDPASEAGPDGRGGFGEEAVEALLDRAEGHPPLQVGGGHGLQAGPCRYRRGGSRRRRRSISHPVTNTAAAPARRTASARRAQSVRNGSSCPGGRSTGNGGEPHPQARRLPRAGRPCPAARLRGRRRARRRSAGRRRLPPSPAGRSPGSKLFRVSWPAGNVPVS